MKVLGVVTWTTADKGGHPIAGVEPLYDATSAGWREINAPEEFPTQGQVFWYASREAVEDALVLFRPEANPGQKDEFQVAQPHLATEVIDLRAIGSPSSVHAALTAGIRLPVVLAGRTVVWCAPDLLVGPLRLLRGVSGLVTFDAPNRDRIPTYEASSCDLRNVTARGMSRTVLAGGTPGLPSGFVDWDADRFVLRRALTGAVERIARNDGSLAMTRRMIDAAAESVTGDGNADLRLERYRLERARALCGDASAAAALANEVADVLLRHPTVEKAHEEAREATRLSVETETRARLDRELTQGLAKLKALQASVAHVDGELAGKRAQLEALERCVTETQAASEATLTALERNLARRTADAVARPAEILETVGLLRPFLSSSAKHRLAAKPRVNGGALDWIRSASALDDRVSLQRALTRTFKAFGVAPGSALRLHAAVIAGVLPIVSGGAALSAWLAYGSAVCAGRVCVLSTSPTFMRPTDVLGETDADGTLRAHATGLLAAAAAAEGLQAPSLFVCEGVNRAPTESFLVPFLQLSALGLLTYSAPSLELSTVKVPAGLRVGATLVSGPSSLPLSPDLCGLSALIEVQRSGGKEARLPIELTELPLASELSTPSDAPDELTEELLQVLPAALDSRSSLERFGAALRRFDDEPNRLKAAMIECVLVPQIAVMSSEEERTDGLEALKRCLGSYEAANGLSALEERLRRRLG